MAVVDDGEMRGKRSGGKKLPNDRDYSRTFRVEVDDPDDRESIVLAADSVPALGDPHPDDASAWCESLAVQCVDEGGKLWEVTAKYSSTADAGSAADNPLSRPVTITWEDYEFEEPVELDVLGKPVLNSAGQAFDPPPTRVASRPVVVFTKNQAEFNASLAQQYKNKSNSDTWWGLSAGQAKVASIRASEEKEENGITYYEVRYEIHLNEDGWKKRILDQGRMERITFESTDYVIYRAIIDPETKRPVTDPVPLNGAGGPLSDDGGPVFLEFDFYGSVPFAPLGLV